ncbi:MAG TPA: hypothetical protein VLD63_03295, partial [Anaerolineales bacterium]|nr:hypothetical protein [Anaerolineales bacterium]
MGVLIFAGLLFIPAARAEAPGEEATRHWVIERLRASLASPLELDVIASMLFGLTNARDVAEQPDSRRVLGELSTRVRSLDPETLGCDEVVNLHVIAGFLVMAGMKPEAAGLSGRVQGCLDELNTFDKASALFALCHFGDPVPRERLVRAMDSIEASQLPDGSFGTGYGLPHFYTTTHGLF